MDEKLTEMQARLDTLKAVLPDIKKYHAQGWTEIRDLLVAKAKAEAEAIVALFP